MFTDIKNNLLWSQGRAIILVLSALLAAGCLFQHFHPSIGVSVYLAAVIGFFIFSFYFFRNPTRVCDAALHSSSIIVCPADGKVVDIQYDKACPFEGYPQKVSIFLSPFDVHVNWVPFAGSVEKMQYKPGAFMFAFLPKSSELNERNDVVFKRLASLSDTIVVRQIAGTVARRICWWVRPGDRVRLGDKYGMIRFGSRVDLFLPAQVELKLVMNQRVHGGKTVCGVWL